MTPDDIRPLLEAQPFGKFYLNLSDGSSFEVDDPAQVSFSASGGVLNYEHRGRRVMIALAHVICIGFPATGGDPLFLRGR
jgi:hypothetical protein